MAANRLMTRSQGEDRRGDNSLANTTANTRLLTFQAGD